MGEEDNIAAREAANAARESVLAVRAVDRAAILVQGKDRTSWLNGLVTCEIAKLGATEGAYGLIVEKKGRIQVDFFLVPARSDGDQSGRDVFALAVPKDLRESVQATLDHYLVMEDAELEAVDLSFWHLHGPKAASVVDALGDAAAYAGTLSSGGAVVASPSPAPGNEAFAKRIAEATASVNGVIADEATWERIRIEQGVPRFGVEVDTLALYPQEASLEKLAVSFEKGCYLGQEVVYMLENRGHVKRKLVPLDVEGEGVLAAGDAVTTPDGVAVGDVKSSVVGPSSGKPVAIAMIKWAQAKPGTELRVGERVARVR